jgi:hypothetical protein
MRIKLKDGTVYIVLGGIYFSEYNVNFAGYIEGSVGVIDFREVDISEIEKITNKK